MNSIFNNFAERSNLNNSSDEVFPVRSFQITVNKSGGGPLTESKKGCEDLFPSQIFHQLSYPKVKTPITE